MMIEELVNWKNYQEMFPERFIRALKWLEEKELHTLENGKYEISATDFAIVQEYDTRDVAEAEYENHHKYIDIQIVVNGEEWIYCSKPKGLIKAKDYLEEDDIEFYHKPENMAKETKMAMKEGYFAVLWPGDCHMPCVNPGKKTHVKKIVIKIRI